MKLLEADEETPARIANLLGLVRTPVATAAPMRLMIQQPEVEVSATIGPAATLEKDQVVRDDEPSVTSRQVLSSTLSLVPSEGFAGFVRDPIPRQERRPTRVRRPIQPLLIPEWTRAILSAALSTSGDDGAVDIEAIVPKIATRSRIDRLPRFPYPTMRRGVQLLLDRGPALVPFARDQDWLAEQVQLVGRSDSVEVAEFFACPSREGTVDDEGKSVGYKTPRPGTAVLVMTDLGIGRPPGWTEWASEAEWLEFALLLRKAGCPLVALVPYSSDRWPPALAASMMILTFDRATAASTVRRVVRGGHVVAR